MRAQVTNDNSFSRIDAMTNRIGGSGGSHIPPYITGPCPPDFGFREERLRQVCSNPDRTHDIQWEGLVVRLLTKGTSDFTDIVGVKIDPQPGVVAFAMRAFPDLCPTPIADLPPLDLLQKLAEKLGLELAIGGESGRFFLTQKIAISAPTAGGQLIDIKNPDNHSFAQSLFIKMDQNPPSVSIALAFCVDTVEYAQWFKSH
jgi:hypothetical protein